MAYLLTDGTTISSPVAGLTSTTTLGGGTLGTAKVISAWTTTITQANSLSVASNTLYTFASGTPNEGVYLLTAWADTEDPAITTLPAFWNGVVAKSSANIQFGSFYGVYISLTKGSSTTINWSHASPAGSATVTFTMFKVI